MSLLSGSVMSGVHGVLVGGYEIGADQLDEVLYPLLCRWRRWMDCPKMRLRGRRVVMRVRPGRIVGEGRWGGFVGKEVGW
jgi:hypothetical protein